MLTQDQRQRFLDNFILQVNGKGRSVRINALTSGVPQYVNDHHPGCSIGCQPEFEPFKEQAKAFEGMPISHLIRMELFGKKLCQAFGITRTNKSDPAGYPIANIDMEFLCGLQRLHDWRGNWLGKYLQEDAVWYFCKLWNLKIPIELYALETVESC